MNFKKIAMTTLMVGAGFGLFQTADAQTKTAKTAGKAKTAQTAKTVSGGIQKVKETPQTVTGGVQPGAHDDAAVQASRKAPEKPLSIAQQILNNFKQEHPTAVAKNKLQDDLSIYTDDPLFMVPWHQYEMRGEKFDTLAIFSKYDFKSDSSSSMVSLRMIVKNHKEEQYDKLNTVSVGVTAYDTKMYESVGPVFVNMLYDYQNPSVNMNISTFRFFSRDEPTVVGTDEKGNKKVVHTTGPGKRIDADTTFAYPELKTEPQDDDPKKAHKALERKYDAITGMYQNFMKHVKKDIDDPSEKEYTHLDGRHYDAGESLIYKATDAANYGKKFYGIRVPAPAEKTPDRPWNFEEIKKIYKQKTITPG